MQTLDLNLLTLILALSVYIASIRFVIVSRLIAEPKPDNDHKAKYRRFLKWLLPPDVLFVIAGLLLFLHIYWSNLFGADLQAPSCLASIVIWCFFLGILCLMGHHIYSWCRTLRS